MCEQQRHCCWNEGGGASDGSGKVRASVSGKKSKRVCKEKAQGEKMAKAVRLAQTGAWYILWFGWMLDNQCCSKLKFAFQKEL